MYEKQRELRELVESLNTPRAKRARAAKRGWETRRTNAARRDRQTFKASTYADEPAERGYTLYEAAHPITGNPDDIALWESRLAGYYGQRVRLTVNGYVIDPETGERVSRIFIRRVREVSGYADFFGAGSMYGNALRVVRDRASTANLLVTSVTVELADSGDDDEESGFE